VVSHDRGEPAGRSSDDSAGSRRADSLRHEERILTAARRLLQHAPDATDGFLRAALRAGGNSASDSVRAIHGAVLAASGGEMEDDATAVCLLAG
jgi:hypothetical protein